jgi:uncharacterized protein involved in outer membrane biogenesis
MAKSIIKIVGKIAKWGLLSVVALVVVVVLLAVFMDWNRLKPYIERAVSEQTGREFAIAGDLSVDLWSWRPSLRAERIRFENAPWAARAQMLKLRAFEASVDLMALIRGRIVIPELIIDRPVVHLAKSSKGEGNWQLKGQPAAEKTTKVASDGSQAEPRAELPAILKLVVRDGRVTYRDPAAEQAMRLAIANISGSTRGNVTLAGHGRLQGTPWRLDFDAGAFEQLLATKAPYPVDLKFEMGDTRARIDGALADAARRGDGALNFSLRGPGLQMLSTFLGSDAPRLPPYQVTGRVTRVGQTWRAQDLETEVGESDLRGELAFDTGRKRPLLKADLRSQRLNYADFAGLVPSTPKAKQQPKSEPLDLSVLKTMDAIIRVRGEEILAPTVALRDLRLDARLQNGRLRVAPLAVDIGGGRIRGRALVDARATPLQASLQTKVQHVNLRKLGRNAEAAQGLNGTLDGRIKISISGASKAQIAKADEANPLASIDRLVIEDSRLSYALPERRTLLKVTADTVTAGGRRRLAIKGHGRYRGEPFELALQSDPLLELANTATTKPYAVSARIRGANTEVKLEGALRQPLAFSDVDLALSIEGTGTDRLAAALGRPLPNLPPYSLKGRLRRQDARWKVNDFDGRLGESDLTGDIALDTGGQRPFIEAELISRRLDYADFKTVLGAEPDEPKAASKTPKPKSAETPGKPAEPPFDLAPLQSFNARISFEGREIIAPKLPLEDVAVEIAVQGGRLRVEPFSVGIGGGTIEGTLSMDSSTPIRGRLTTDIDQVDVQQLVEPFDLKSKFGVLDGRAEIAIIGSTKAQIAAAAEQTPLTFIHSLVITDTRFAYVDPNSDIDVDLAMHTTESSNGAEPVIIDGRGRYQGEDFTLHVGAGSLLRLLEEQRPYPVEARAEVAQTTAKLKGTVLQPLDIKGLNLSLAIKGPNPSRLEKLAGLPLPDLPPYSIEGEVSRDGATWRLNDFEGRVGDSDLAGDLSVRTLRDPRPLLIAKLTSRRLDLDDLSGLVGAAPDTGQGETESGQQQQEAKTETRTTTVLPRDPIDLSSLGAIDAQVRFRGKRVETGLPIDDLRIDAELDDGRLALKPLDFGVGGGTIKSRLQLDGSARPVQAEMQTEVSRVNLKELLRGSGFAQQSVGHIGGRARLKATGDSIADLMATLDGGLSLIMTGGRINSLLIELGGLDVAQAVGDLIGDVEPKPIRCAFLDLAARDGQVDIQSFVIDTTDTRFSGDGDINLDEERVRFVVAPHPKDFSLLTFRTPLHIRGRFSDLQFYPEYSELAERTVAAVALGLVATPFAALIPLIETGTGKNAACQSLLHEANDEERAIASERGVKSAPAGKKDPPEASFIRSNPTR